MEILKILKVGEFIGVFQENVHHVKKDVYDFIRSFKNLVSIPIIQIHKMFFIFASRPEFWKFLENINCINGKDSVSVTI